MHMGPDAHGLLRPQWHAKLVPAAKYAEAEVLFQAKPLVPV